MTRIRELRKQKGMTAKKLGESINVAESTISLYENGKRAPDYDTLCRLADLFGVSVDYILEREDTSQNHDTIYSASNIIPLPKTYDVPLIGDIACGTPILAEENIEDVVHVPESITADFCLRCKGDSMIGARIMDGDIVFIRQQDDVDNGQIAAVLIDDEATLKRVYKTASGVVLQAENPAFPPMAFSEKDAKNIRILGLAVAFTSVIK